MPATRDVRLKRRRLFGILGILLPSVCLALAALWVRSYFVYDAVGWNSVSRKHPLHHCLYATAREGTLALGWADVLRIPENRAGFFWVGTEGDGKLNPNDRWLTEILRFPSSRYHHDEATGRVGGFGIRLPFWAIIAVTVMLFAFVIRRRSQSRQDDVAPPVP